MGIQMLKSHNLADHLNTENFGPLTGFLQFSFQNTGPFDNHTQIYHLNTRLVWYSDGYYTAYSHDLTTLVLISQIPTVDREKMSLE